MDVRLEPCLGPNAAMLQPQGTAPEAHAQLVVALTCREG